MRRPDIHAQTDVTGATSLEDFMAGAGETSQRAKNAPQEALDAPDRTEPLEAGSRRPGRPSAAPEELLSERVQIKLTTAELAAIKTEAGMVPISRFLRAKLKDAGVI